MEKQLERVFEYPTPEQQIERLQKEVETLKENLKVKDEMYMQMLRRAEEARAAYNSITCLKCRADIVKKVEKWGRSCLGCSWKSMQELYVVRKVAPRRN